MSLPKPGTARGPSGLPRSSATALQAGERSLREEGYDEEAESLGGARGEEPCAGRAGKGQGTHRRGARRPGPVRKPGESGSTASGGGGAGGGEGRGTTRGARRSPKGSARDCPGEVR